METKTEQKRVIEGTVVAVAKTLRNYMGKIQLGVRLKVGDVEDWYNAEGPTDALEALQNSGTFARGNVVRCVLAGKLISDAEVVSTAPKRGTFAGRGPEGDDVVDLEALLDAAHRRGLRAIRTECMENTPDRAVFRATVEVEIGPGTIGVFQGHGDAAVVDVPASMKPHFLRFAETRAICRALRWATNNAQATEEEKAGPEAQG